MLNKELVLLFVDIPGILFIDLKSMDKRISKVFLYAFITVTLLQIYSSYCWAQGEAPFADLFKQGTQSYSEKKFDQAQDFFSKALVKDPQNSTVLTNLALVQFQLGHKAKALAHFRKALDIEPNLQEAKAGLKFVLSQMEIKEIPHQLEFYESLRDKLLAPVSLQVYLGFTALFLFASGWTLISYLGKRRKAIGEESALPGFPILSTCFLGGLLIILSLSILKAYDSSIQRATIVEEKVSLQSAPGETQVGILDLYAGMEVIVRITDNGWTQVTYPGAITGWVKSDSLMVTSGL